MKEKLEKIIKEALQNLGIQAGTITLEHPADLAHGDFSTNASLAYAKQAGKNPRTLAEEIVATLRQAQGEFPEIQEIQIAGPGFINFYLSKEFFADSIKEIIKQGDAFGNTKIYAGEKWAIEYASPNPNKAMHLGHLRNVLTGVSVCRILEANGAAVVREMVDNNRGIAIAKLMWGYLVFARNDAKRIEDVDYWADHQDEWQTPGEAGVRPDRFVDELYVRGAAESEDPEMENKIRDLVVRWEAKDAAVWKLWQKVLSYAYEGQKHTLNRLGATFDFVWHEHEHYEEGKRFVQNGLEKGVFKKIDDGAIITNLASYDMPDTVVVKRDGTALYITQDIALTDIKKKKHHADKMIWIIGPEQSLAMQQLFAVCEQLGIGKREEFIHLPYGYVSIKGQGKMSSRKGNVIYLDEVLDEAKEGVKSIMQGRVPDESVDTIAEKISFAAIAFGVLKAGRTTDTAFDLVQALRLEGDTGPYLQYATVRAGSILEKAKTEKISANATVPAGWNTTDLEKNLYRFPEVVEYAGQEFAPSTVATYLLELSGSFNSFYSEHMIVDAKDPFSPYKLVLTQAFRTTMKNGLWLLGIEVPEKM